MSEVYHDSPEEKERRRLLRKASEDKRREKIRAADRARSTTDEHRAKRRERERPKREARRAQKEVEKRNAPPPPPVLFKLCPRCNPPIEKPIEAFSLDKNRSNGHYPICKECVATGKHANLERRRAYNRGKMLNNDYRKAGNQKRNEWRRENPLSQKELTLRRNARKKAATTERVNYEAILERDGLWCYICEKSILPDQKFEFDHVIPLIPLHGGLQGTHSENNIKPVHMVCNRRKANRQLEDLTAWDRRGL